ncbi:unnamed protein product [Arabidopsis thaliana]|uniref:Uncharacterized protein n=1 Tax=Arabidopsis thaliana TaxID=3702 RepID=A0A654EU51_ARATH|nr:unnamed protein product [Arabidopsis thaliana]
MNTPSDDSENGDYDPEAKEDGNSISGLGNTSDEDGNITSTSLSCSSIGFGSRVLEELSYVHLETGSP